MPNAKDIRHMIEMHVPGAQLKASERLVGGVSAEVHRLDLLQPDGSERRIVLRCHGTTHSGHDAELEFELLKSLFEAGLPVPKPISVDATRKLLEHPYLLIEFVDGSSSIAQSRVKTYIDKMAEVLAMVHGTATDTLPALPPRLDPLPELLDFLSELSEWCDLRDYLSKLENSAFEGKPALLHGDFWPSNLIWSDKNIISILDWEDAAIGDPISDVACTCLELRYIYGEKEVKGFLSSYANLRQIESKRLALWLVYVAAAALLNMGCWRLEPSREAHMRRTAIRTMEEASTILMAR